MEMLTGGWGGEKPRVNHELLFLKQPKITTHLFITPCLSAAYFLSASVQGDQENSFRQLSAESQWIGDTG